MYVKVQRVFSAPVHPVGVPYVETDEDGVVLIDGQPVTLPDGLFVTFASLTTDARGKRQTWTIPWEDPGIPKTGDAYDIIVKDGDVVSVRFVVSMGGDNVRYEA